MTKFKFWNEVCKYGAIIGLVMSVAFVIEQSLMLSGWFSTMGLVWVLAAAYNRNAPPYKAKPDQNGQLLKAASGSAREGNFLGGSMANLTKILADALAAIPSTKINHCIRESFALNDSIQPRKTALVQSSEGEIPLWWPPSLSTPHAEEENAGVLCA
jgi:hypothetical protein